MMLKPWVDKMFYKILAMPSDKKVVVDQNVSNLIEPLKSVGVNKVYDVSKLGLDPQSETDDNIQIKKRLKELGKQTPNSGFLFITRNGKHFKNPDRYDVLVLPDKLDIQGFVESFKQWLVLMPSKAAKSKVYKAKKRDSKYSADYVFEETD